MRGGRRSARRSSSSPAPVRIRRERERREEREEETVSPPVSSLSVRSTRPPCLRPSLALAAACLPALRSPGLKARSTVVALLFLAFASGPLSPVLPLVHPLSLSLSLSLSLLSSRNNTSHALSPPPPLFSPSLTSLSVLTSASASHSAACRCGPASLASTVPFVPLFFCVPLSHPRMHA